MGYGGDVWPVQPAPRDMPWCVDRSGSRADTSRRKMVGSDGRGNAMTPHYSGTTLDAQKRYADGTIEIIEQHLNGKDITPANLICENGEVRRCVFDPC